MLVHRASSSRTPHPARENNNKEKNQQGARESSLSLFDVQRGIEVEILQKKGKTQSFFRGVLFNV